MSRLCAVYCRISRDDRGDEAGVQRQEQDCREYAVERGYTVSEVFIDNDRSASARARHDRPQYATMLERTRSGEFDALIAWSSSRFTRQVAEASALSEIRAERKRSGTPLRLLTVKTGEADDSAFGRVVTGFRALLDEFEADNISERVSRAARQRAEQGKAFGRYMYGWDRRAGRDVLNDEEAGHVREAGRRALAGEALNAIATDFRRRGVVTPKASALRKRLASSPEATPPDDWQDKPWDSIKVRQILLRSQNSGVIRFHGAEGTVESRHGAPIWDEGMQASIEALLLDPRRRKTRGSAPRHLLSGILRCGKHPDDHRVQGRLGGRYTGEGADGRRRSSFYACAQECAGVRGPLEEIDVQVQALVLARLMQEDGPDLLARDEDAARQAREAIAGHRARMNTAADKWADGAIDDEQLDRITATMRARIAEAERTIADNAPSPAVAEFNAAARETSVPEAWERQPLSVRRAIIDQLATFNLLPSPKRGAPWDESRLRLAWRRG